eukprot:jgi/Tetstr1/456709/TSEL_043409.t1
MAPKKNEPAKDKEDKDDATPGPSQVPETKPEPEIEHTEPEPEPEPEPETEPTQMEPEPEPEPEPETPAPTTGQASGSGASGSRAPIAEAPRRVPEFLSMCTDEEVFGTEEEQRQRAAEKRKQALDITGTPGPERKTKLMTVASYDDFFDERDGSQEDDSYSDLTSRSWTIHWFKNASAEVEIYLYIELHKASLLTGKDFFDDPEGPLLACIGKIKDVELDSAGNYEISLEPYRLTVHKEFRIDVSFERLLLHAIQPPLSFQPRFQSYYAWTLVERNVLAQALTDFACGQIDINDLANIDKDFKNALPYVNTLAVPPALNGFHNTGAVDWISYGHLRVEIADPEVKTSHGGDINTLYADRVNLVVDKDTGLPHIFSFISDKFVAPPPEFEFRSPKLQDCNMVAQSYKRNPSLSAENFSVSFPVVPVQDFFSDEFEPLAQTMANFKELVAAHEGGENPRREAKRMVKENYPEIYKANKGIHLTSAKMYIGLSPEVCRYMSMKLNEAGHTVVGDTSMHKLLISEAYRHVDLGVRGWDEARTKLGDLFVYYKQELNRVKRLNSGRQLTQKEDVGFGPHAPWLDEPSLAKQSDSADLPVGQMYLVVGLLIQGEHSVTPSLYELVDDIKHAGDDGPMAVTHTNAEWLAMIETWRFRDLLRRASIKLMNVIDTAKGRETIQLLTPDEPARNWGKYLSDHIIDWDVQDKVSDEQAAARLDAITKFQAKVDDLGPTGFPRKFQDLFKEHIAATNTTIKSEAYRIKNQMPDLVISFFTKFALLACAPELIAVSAPNVSNELWISMKAEELPVMPKGEGVDKDDKVWLNTELCKTCIVEGNFKAPATKQFVADAMSAVRARKATVFIADALFGAGSHTWDSKDDAWGTDDFNDVFAFARQDNPHNPAVQKQAEDLIFHVLTWAKDCGMKMGSSLRHDAEYYLYVAAAFSVWWDHMDHSYSFTHRNLKIILIDNQKTQIAGMKSRMISWFKEKPWDETQQLRPTDFEKWPGLPHPMTVSEEFSERLEAAKKRREAAERRGYYVIEDDDT